MNEKLEIVINKKRANMSYLFNKLKIDRVDISNLKTVCLFLGPYRNLTTLTASILFLHPNVQVFNHGGVRIYDNKKVNFFNDYSDEKFDLFCKYLIYYSKSGRGGDYGGSILYSHAFFNKKLINLYKSRYGYSRVKDKIDCIVWKESLRNATYFRDNNIDLKSILIKNNKIRFILPVRNPMDCAMSNKRMDFSSRFDNLKDKTLKSYVNSILLEFKWFLEKREEKPESFFYFFQDDYNEAFFKKLAGYLMIDADEKWIKDCLDFIQIKKSYKHEQDLVNYYTDLVDRYFKNYPDFADRLKKFT